MATATSTMLEAVPGDIRNEPQVETISQDSGHKLQETSPEKCAITVDGLKPPSDPTPDTGILLRYISAGFSFFVAGVNDGGLGVIIPYVLDKYQISTAVVSSVYAANLAGWLFAAVSNTHLSQRLDLGAMLALGAALQVAAQALRSWPTPPLGVFIFSFWLTSVGQAYQDTHANTFVATISSSNGGSKTHRWLGFIHAMYMGGCLVGPFAASPIASSGIATGTSRWYLFYTVPLGLGVTNVALATVAFRSRLGLLPKKGGIEGSSSPELEKKDKTATELIKATLTNVSVWTLSLFFFFYLGASITVGGWVVEYLVEVRNGDLAQMGYLPAGFNGGCLLGRTLLPEPTNRLGERKMVFLYCLLCVAFQLVFWLVPNIVAMSVSFCFLGFFSGPLFAAAISVGSKLFPPEIRSTAISFVFLFAQVGGSLFPIITGVLGSHVGVSVIQPVLVGLFSATAISWLLVPRVRKLKETH